MTTGRAADSTPDAQDPHDAPLVSCIMIFLDGAEFIDEAIRSVVDQVGFDDWELILVDDGSTDESVDIGMRWAARMPDRIVRLEHPGHENRGMSASRNLGVQHARGRFVTFLDCDDIWLPSALAHRARVLRHHPTADALVGATWRWYSWDGARASERRDGVLALPLDHEPRPTLVEPPALFVPMFEAPVDRPVPTMCSLLIRREALVRAGGMDDSFRALHEDQVLYAKIAMHMPTVIDSRPLALYRHHDSSSVSSSVAEGRWSADERRFLEWLEGFVEDRLGAASPELVTVRGHIQRLDAPTESPSRLRRIVHRVLPESVVTTVRELKSKRAGRASVSPDAPVDVVSTWSRDHLQAWPTPGPKRCAVVRATKGESWRRGLPTRFLQSSSALPITPEEIDGGPSEPWDLLVVPAEVTCLHDWREILGRLPRLARPGTGIVVFFEGRHHPSVGAEPTERPSRGDVERLARERFAGLDVTVERFGNEPTRSAIAAGLPASMVPGVWIDDHRGGLEVILALTIEHPG